MQQIDLILKSEELFAREVALGVVVTRPLKGWLYVIPGMFIIDFLRRQQSIGRYTRYYMFPRKQALAGSAALINSTDTTQVYEEIESAMQQWLSNQVDDPTELAERQLRVINTLMDHYRKLLAAQGNNYVQLLRNAYSNREDLDAIMQRLSELESDRDQLMPDSVMDDYQKRHLEAVQSQVVMRRTDLVDAVFQL